MVISRKIMMMPILIRIRSSGISTASHAPVADPIIIGGMIK